MNANTKAAFWPKRVCDASALRAHLGYDGAYKQKDPRCRFMSVLHPRVTTPGRELSFLSFVHAPNSRDKLCTTRYMLALSLTYQQVMPGFLDFVFPFGKQINERDFHFGGFRYQNRLPDPARGLQVPQLGWSGRDYKLCFNLKSVEQAKGGGEPWSIRQAAVHHSFDVESGQSSWIVIKANDLLQRRIQSATGSRGLPKVSSYEGLGKAFASTLATHLIFCEWSGENWRWYINFLEGKYQEVTQRTLTPLTRAPTSPISGLDQSPPRQNTLAQDKLEMPPSPEMKQPPDPPPVTKPLLVGFQYLADSIRDPPQSPYDSNPTVEVERHQAFSFTDLQRIQNTEEKANAAMLILKNNVSVFAELKIYYRTINTFQGWPCRLTSQCAGDILHFEQDLSSIENDMQLQLSRIGTLLQLIADRKSLVNYTRCSWRQQN